MVCYVFVVLVASGGEDDGAAAILHLLQYHLFLCEQKSAWKRTEQTCSTILLSCLKNEAKVSVLSCQNV